MIREILKMGASEAIEYLIKKYRYHDDNGDYFYINHIEVSYIGGSNVWQIIIGYRGEKHHGEWCDTIKKIGDFKKLDDAIPEILNFIKGQRSDKSIHKT